LPTAKQSRLGLANYILDMNHIVRCYSADEQHNVIARGQANAPQNHEKSSRDQDREAQKISEVGHHTHVRKENGAPQMPARRLPHSLADWLASRTKEIGLPHR
jgi:hypothetical protein